MTREKLYAVDVMQKRHSGRNKKIVFASWCLTETSKQRACDFAYEIVAGMTWSEIFETENRTLLPIDELLKGTKVDDLIGFESAEKYFSYRAEIYT